MNDQVLGYWVGGDRRVAGFSGGSAVDINPILDEKTP